MRKMLLAGLTTGLLLATTVQAEKVVVIPLNVPSDHESFYVTLDTDQEEKIIASFGPLRYFARCSINVDIGGGIFKDRIEIFSTSTESPWYDEVTSLTLAANHEQMVYDISSDPGVETYNNEIDNGSMVGPGGYYMSIDGESLGLGLNIYGHACTVVGSVLKVKKK